MSYFLYAEAPSSWLGISSTLDTQQLKQLISMLQQFNLLDNMSPDRIKYKYNDMHSNKPAEKSNKN